MLIASCKESDVKPSLIVDVTTSNGNIISLNGQWTSGCVTDMGNHLDEVFSFEDNNLLIDISIFKEENCSELAAKEKITIQFYVVGTIKAQLNGESVIANKIEGTQTMQSSGVTKEFKQIFYVNDSDGALILHHARFQNDGGAQSSDGFPIELIPIDIVKQ
ncbi:hypothetical protein [Ekhidna sp.]|uniref:hypothetical protein n=1 Tax=Ekhidna sp. TaxID=2608089 RepID=UPI003B5C16EC